MLGLTALGTSWKIQTGVGAACLAVAGTFVLLPAVGAPTEIMFGAIGPMIAGIANLAIGLGFKKAVLRHGPELPLSDEARALLKALVVRAQVWEGGWQPRRRMHGPHALMGRTAPAEPPRAAMEALEKAAAAHNRIVAALGESRDDRAARLLAAADAGMGESLEQAARIATSAESETAGLAVMEDVFVRLGELAERVESNARQPEGASALRSTLNATLEELRAEDVARQELRG